MVGLASTNLDRSLEETGGATGVRARSADASLKSMARYW